MSVGDFTSSGEGGREGGREGGTDGGREGRREEGLGKGGTQYKV